MSAARALLVDHEVADGTLPIWREVCLGWDWVRLRSSPVYYGWNIPKGDGSAVVVVPGFLGHDVYLIELYTWLWRMGYSPYMSRIGRNADCPNILIDHLLRTIRRAHEKTGKRVHLIGHSLGGVLSLGAAVLEPALTGVIITLGSPIRGPKVHPWVLYNAALVRNRIHRNGHKRPADKPLLHDCFTYSCACGFACTTRKEAAHVMPEMAVYTKTDGIVDWKMCVTDDASLNREVTGTHCGLAWNPDVYRLIADTLHEGPKRPVEDSADRTKRHEAVFSQAPRKRAPKPVSASSRRAKAALNKKRVARAS